MAEKQRILAVGDRRMAETLYPEAEIDHANMRGFRIGARRYGKGHGYDSVVSYFALNMAHFSLARKTLDGWCDSLAPGGSLHIFVPSLEWAAVQILSEEQIEGFVLDQHIFGGLAPNNFMSGYTMMDLRVLCESVGMAVTYARQGTYQIQHGEKLFDCGTNYVMAIKPKVQDG